MKKDNRGLSMVEMIIVVTILIVVSTAGVLGFNMLSGKAAKQCAEQIKSSLSLNRTHAMGKRQSSIRIYCENNAVYTVETVDTEVRQAVKVGGKNLTVEWSEDDLNYTSLDDSGVELSFDKSSGARTVNNDFYFRITYYGKAYKVHVYHLTGRTEVVES